jgi:hypothetical protein
LTDCLRGTRESPDPSCASLLAPLVSEFGADRVEIRMYHTPNLTGLRKKHIPKRINEGWGLQHMKLYGMDDEVIISGYVVDYFTTLHSYILEHKKGKEIANTNIEQISLQTILPIVKIGTMFSPQQRSRPTSPKFIMPSPLSLS